MRGLRRPDERAHHPTPDLARQHLGVQPRIGEEGLGVLELIDAGRFDRRLFEPHRAQLAEELFLGQGSGHTPHPELHALTHLGRDLPADHDVAHGEAPPRLQHPERFGEDLRLVGGKVDDTVGDDHVHRVVGEGDRLDVPLEELDVGGAGLERIGTREGEHLVRHVEAVCLAGGPHAVRGEQHVDPATGAEVEHHFTLVQFGERGRIAAPE